MNIVKISSRNIEEAVGLEKGLALFESKFDRKMKIDKKRIADIRKNLKKSIRDRKSLCLMVEHNGENIALLIGEIFHKRVWRTDIGRLCDLYVIPAYRRKGVGKLLVREFERWLKARKVRHVELSVYYDNVLARKAWERMGFSPSMVSMSKGIR